MRRSRGGANPKVAAGGIAEEELRRLAALQRRSLGGAQVLVVCGGGADDGNEEVKVNEKEFCVCRE